MIKAFKSKDLSTLFAGGKSKIDARLHKRIFLRLNRMNAAERVEEMNLPGFDFHALRGFKPTRYSVHVNGPWCITFEFLDGHIYQVDLEQYH